jgi:hypothetical protein
MNDVDDVHTVIYLLPVNTVTIRRTTSFGASRARIGEEIWGDRSRYNHTRIVSSTTFLLMVVRELVLRVMRRVS